MTKLTKRQNSVEHEALEGMLLLSTQQKTTKTCLAVLQGSDRYTWAFEVYQHRFKITDDENAAIFYYCNIERSWFVFRVSGKIRIDNRETGNVGMLRNGSYIEIGNIKFFFEVKFIVRREYKKLLTEIILSCPEKKCSLSEIYHKLLTHYGFSMKKNTSWKNSIRCVLSESKIFYKIPKKIKQGRGGYWCVNDRELAKMEAECVKKCERNFYNSLLYDRQDVVYTAKQLIYGSCEDPNENIDNWKKPADTEYVHVSSDKKRKTSVFPNAEQCTMASDVNIKKPRLLPWSERCNNGDTPDILQNNLHFNMFELDNNEDPMIYNRAGRNSVCNIDDLSSEFSCLSVKTKRNRRK